MPETTPDQPPEHQIPELVVVQLWALQAAFQARLDRSLSALGITAAGFRLVGELLGAPEGLRQSELARRLGVRAPTVSVAVSRLEADGIVTRQEDPEDPRAWKVRLAPGAPLGAGIQVLQELEHDLVGDLSDDDRLALISLLERVRARLSQPRSHR